MTKIEKQEILVPLLEKYYPNEESFNDNFKDVIKTGGDLYLARPFGISIIITNIITTEEANRVVHLLENNDHFEQTLHLFSWENVPGDGSDRLLRFLRDDLDIDWAENAKIHKSDDGKTIRIFKVENSAEIMIDEEQEKATLKISDGRTHDLKVKKENGKLNIYKFDQMDESMFEKESEISFERWIFKSKRDMKIEIEDGDGKVLNFFLFISIACTNLDHHIVSFNFTTWDESKIKEGNIEDAYVRLSNKQIIDLVKNDSDEFEKLKEELGGLEQEIKNLLSINKNTFLSIQFWREDWKSEEDNLLDAKDNIKQNPYYFYSIITLDKNVFRRNYKNIMDVLGWCFSTSRVYLGMFSQNAYLELTIKPRKDRSIAIGHDASEFKAWEILGLQKYLLDQINIAHSEYTKKHQGIMASKVDKLIEELNKLYDFNAFIQKKKKGESWINFNIYLQDIIGISSDRELYENRHERKKEGEDRKSAVRLARLNAVLSSLIFATVFVSILTFLLHPETRLTATLGNFTISEILNVGKYSLCATIILSIILSISFISVFKLIEVIIYKYKK